MDTFEPIQSAFDVPPPHSELRRLEPLIGVWHSADQTRDSILGSGVAVESVEKFYWLDGGYFLVSEYQTQFGDEPMQKGVMYWGYDADAGKFQTHFFSNNGTYTRAGNEYVGEVKGNKLTFIGPAKFEYELDEQGRILTGENGSITVRWWLQNAQGQWQEWMRNTFTRINQQTRSTP